MKNVYICIQIVFKNALEQFTGSPSLDISEITGKFLRGFEAYLYAEPSQRGRNCKDPQKRVTAEKGSRAVLLYMARIRAAYNMARREFNDEDSGPLPVPRQPFNNYSIGSADPTPKRAISPEAVQLILDLPPLANARAARPRLLPPLFRADRNELRRLIQCDSIRQGGTHIPPPNTKKLQVLHL